MPEIDLDKSVLGFMPMVRLHWGVPHNELNDRLFVRADQDQELYDVVRDKISTWTAIPEMEIEFEKQDGGTESRPVRVTLPIDLDPIEHMVAGTFATVTATILEADFTDTGADPRVVFLGQVSKTKARFKGKSRLCQLEVHGRKLYLKDVSLGMKATDRCPWFFGDVICGFILTPSNATVTSIDGTTMLVSGLTDNDTGWSLVSGRYTRGFVERDGLRIMIRQHTPISGLNGLFIMAKAPPQSSGFSWVGENVNCNPGCDKTIEACQFYFRTHRFGGIGRLMPDHDPIQQDPSGGVRPGTTY